jgi:electron transfer flavoprotein alpha subunit
MAKVLVIAKQRDGRLKKTTFELLGASAAGNETHALLLGDGVRTAGGELAHYGAAHARVAGDAGLNFCRSLRPGRALGVEGLFTT